MLAWALDHLRIFNDPGEYSYWLYFVTAFCLAVTFLVVRRRMPLKAALARVFDREVWLGRSARADYWHLAINEVLFRVPNVAAFVWLVNTLNAQVTAAIGPSTPIFGGTPLWLASAFYTVYTLVMLDLGSFVTHWMQHEIPFFWRFHAVHHSAERMNPVTVFRQHPLDAAHYMLFRAVAAGVGSAFFPLLFPAVSDITRIAGVNAALFLYYLSAGLRHSHVPFAYPKWTRKVLFSPHMHQIHHSREERHINCNYGVIFAFWDVWLGTYRDDALDSELRYGIANEEKPYAGHSVLRMYLEPLGIKSRKTEVPGKDEDQKGDEDRKAG